ncbi:MAG: AprI/Inh family metalloprotease inhibitor, partial [Hyphomicrobiales bacterium]
PVCLLTLAMTKAAEGLAVTVKPGCDAAIARVNFTQWRIDRDELMLVPARGNPWRFEEVDSTTWRRMPETADQITLVRQ